MASIISRAEADKRQAMLSDIGNFHSAKDGKGIRYAYVNGNHIEYVKWANIEQGLLCFVPNRHLTKRDKHKGKRYTRLLRGTVTVEFIKHEAKTIAEQA